jgi:prepilin-type N-terminal cleavage/methylation domain-containing protein
VTQGNPIHRRTAAGAPAWLARLVSRARLRLRKESGFTLIEVIVSSGLLAIVTLGVFAGLDGATKTSAQDRSRSIAVGLAQKDQDRLRAMKFTDLAEVDETRTVTEGPIDYRVTSKADWIADASGTVSCTSTTTTVDYLRITSTVTWPGIGRGRGEVVDTLVPPPPGVLGTQGGLAVRVVDEVGDPVAGLPVSVRGPASRSRDTNEAGCAFFPSLPSGSYTAEFSRSGWVDLGGQTQVAINATVTAGQVDVLPEYAYAPAATINATFDTVDSTGTRTFTGRTIMVNGPALAAPAAFTGGTTGPKLFPHPGGYTAWAGDCAEEVPATPFGVTPARGEVVDTVLRMPTIDVTVRRGTSLYASGARVYFRPPSTSNCSAPPMQTTNTSGPRLGQTEIALPHGTWTVCAQENNSNPRRSGWQPINNVSPGPNALTLTIPTSGSTSQRICNS